MYNSVEDNEEIERIKRNANGAVYKSSLDDVQRVTSETVINATNHLKSGKTDPSCKFSSDCFMHGPDALFELLSTVIQMCLVHSHIT